MRAKRGNAIVKTLVVLALIGAGTFLAFQGFRETAIVAEVKRGSAVDAVPGSVEVYADKDLQELKIEGAGRVIECGRLDPGSSFTKGEVLLKLDASEIVRNKEEAKRLYDSNLKLAEIRNRRNSDKQIAQQRLENVRSLFKLDSVSAEEVNNAQRALDVIETALEVAEFNAKKEAEDHKRAMEAYEIQLKKMTVVAPTDGMIQGVRVNVGTLVNGGTVVATFYSNDRVVLAKIGEEDIAKVKDGDPAEVQLLTFPGRKFTARVKRRLPFADAESRRYNVYLDVDAELSQLRPNSTGEVVITVGTHDNVPLVPRRAVFNGSNGFVVFVVKDNRVERRQIEVGYRGLNTVEVAKGVAPGERVIVENLDQFRDGQYVRVESSP